MLLLRSKLPFARLLDAMLFAATLFAATALPAPALAGAGHWFHHEFGELRAYHGDWLNVCETHGLGSCRTVQLPIEAGEDPFFSSRRLAVHIATDGTKNIDLFQRNMPTPPQSPIVIIIDGQVTALEEKDWSVGSHQYPNVLESITLTNKDLVDALVTRMKAGNRITITYGHEDGARTQANFNLRGITAAIGAIETLYKTQKRTP